MRNCPRAWLSVLLLSLALGWPATLLGADPATRNYRIQYPPATVTGAGLRLDDQGNIFAVSSLPHNRSFTTTFIIYRPSRNGGQPPGVQKIPGPVTPNMGAYDLVDVNQHGQFICFEHSFGFGHRFVWDGAAFVELQDPRSLENPSYRGFSDQVAPVSIHNDGSIWGTADQISTHLINDFGGEVRWDLSGNPNVTFAFRSVDDPLRIGPRRNEKGYFLRFDRQDGAYVHAALWDGMSATLGATISHPPSIALQLNDQNELAGVTATTHEAWINLPAPDNGLGAGYHLLSGVTVDPPTALFFNNLGQVFVGTADPAAPLQIHRRGAWHPIQALDADGSAVPINSILDGNALGTLLALVVPSNAAPATRLALLTPDDLVVTAEATPRDLTAGDEFDLQLNIRNNSDGSLFKVGILVPSLFLSGALNADWIKAPPALLNLAPGQSGVLHYLFRTKGPGKLQVRFQVQGLDAAGTPVALTESLASPQITVTGPTGDLILKREVESSLQYGGDGVHQTVAADPQIRSNIVGTNETSSFDVVIHNNDDKKPRVYRLAAVESDRQGWDVHYLWGGQDITAHARTLTGAEFPPLATNGTYIISVQMTPTNVPVGSIMQSTLALSATNSPLQTLDVVQANTELAREIVVNSTGDLPETAEACATDCGCDTGRTLPNGDAECTLRAALEVSNHHPGKDIIRFQIPEQDPKFGGGLPLLAPRRELPRITDAVVIDGFSQAPGIRGPAVELTGASIPRPPAPPAVDLDLYAGELLHW